MISGDVRAAAGVEGEFYEMLREFHGHWRRIDVVCPRVKEARARTIFGRVHLHPVGRFAYPDLRAKLSQPFYLAKTATRLLKERVYALMVIHEIPPFHTSLAALCLARQWGVPVVSEIHHVEGHPFAPDWPSRLRRLATAWWVRFIKNKVQAIRTVNAAEVPAWLEARGVSPERIKVLYSFDLDLETFRPRPTARDVDFLFVGRLVANKGILLFLEALDLVHRHRAEVRAEVIGQGPLAEAARRQASKAGLAQSVEFIPWVKDRQALAEHYRRAKALVVCSFAEGGPNVALEAMACATPVIGPAIGVLREVLVDGRNGLVTSHDPARLAGLMDRILTRPDLAEKMGAAGPASVARFESKAVIAAYAKGLQEVARKSAARAD